MSKFSSPTAEPADAPCDPLGLIEWRIARRADELARARPPAKGLHLHCWMLAEVEIWNQYLPAGPRTP